MRRRTRVRRWASVCLFGLCAACCDHGERRLRSPDVEPALPALPSETMQVASWGEAEEGRWSTLRRVMVSEQLEARDITDRSVLEAMSKVPRHLFVPDEMRARAYEDTPLPIGWNQTISQPYVVALMTQALRLSGDERVLEIGTGSGYQAAVLAALCREVYSIEIVPSLSKRAGEVLVALGFDNVFLRRGDGYRGWPDAAPFDAIMVTAAPPEVPRPLIEQLSPGGRLIAPVGEVSQELVLIERRVTGLEQQKILPVRFVPMTGEAQRR